MYRKFSLIFITAILLTTALTGCDSEIKNESTTVSNESIQALIDKTTPMTDGDLIKVSKTDENGNLSIEYYDADDNLVENFVWGDNGTIISHHVMKYNENNKITSKEEIAEDGNKPIVESYNYDNNGELSSVSKKEFSQGNLTKETIFNDAGDVTQYIYNHFENGLLLKTERCNSDNKINEYVVNEYNDKAQLIKATTFDSDNKQKNSTTFEYSDKHLIKESYFDSNDNLTKYYVFTYNADGTTNTSTLYDADGNIKAQ